ncbi:MULTISPECIES: ATP synthase subunit I [unclassified Paenibacillus]|uniref:ATP synthase subunit I n=1 Tax=unclassified Paenibacillus TaxID=185978 RepID=UPI001AE26792|nr:MULTISPECIES: ATP synthase subunit I [unclassified Paenibacillus]MBP1153210.1 ATP synthase protein I [Paenibacillus sp. PvP091]MBP1171407.1 ATP synthase protein I [Paenibacillus sp. PvR098]MBP2442435.1 ATP synthase protein I [Paenibacillus sp. PvP052]
MRDQLKSIVRASLFFLSALLLLWAVFPDYRTHVNGLVLGMMVSLINAWMLMLKIEALAVIIVDKDNEQTRKRINMGFISRLSMAILAVMFAVRMPQSFDVVFTIIGFSFIQVALLLKGLLFREKK